MTPPDSRARKRHASVGPSGDATARRVLLVSMPWAHDDMPSIQVGALQAFLRAGGVDVDGGHWFVDIAHALGFENYRDLWSPVLEDGEALYSYLLFPEMRAALLRDPRLRTKAKRLAAERPRRGAARLPFELSERFFRRFGRLHQAILDRYDWSRYLLVGLTLNYGQTVASLYIAREIKKRNPSCRIIVGGAEASGQLGVSLLRHFPQLDYACNGEGEKPLLNLARAIRNGEPIEQIATIPGIASRASDGSIRINSPDQLRRLAELPIPEFEDYFRQIDALGGVARHEVCTRLPIEASRGCYYACSFCSIPLQWSGVRTQAPEKVAAAMRAYADRYRILELEFVDNVNPANAEAIFETVASDGRDYRFFYELRAGVPHRVLKSMRRAGLSTTQMGIEAFSSSLLRKFNKRSKVITNLQGMKNCLALGIRMRGNLIVDHPFTSLEDVEETLRNMSLAHCYPPPDDISYFALEVGAPDFETAAEGAIVVTGNHRSYRRAYPGRLLATLDLTRKAYRLRVGSRVRWEVVIAARKQWAREYDKATAVAGPGVPHLAYYDGGGFLRIEDYRSGGLVVFTLDGVERDVCLAADQVISWKTLRATLANVPEATLRRELAELVATGLMFEEDDSFLSLAIAGHASVSVRATPERTVRLGA